MEESLFFVIVEMGDRLHFICALTVVNSPFGNDGFTDCEGELPSTLFFAHPVGRIRPLLTRLRRTGQAVDIDARRAGAFQQAGQSFGGGAGGQHVINQSEMPTL